MDIRGSTLSEEASDSFNARWTENIVAYHYWARCLRHIHGLRLKFDYTIEFDRKRRGERNYYDLTSEVHLTKLLLSVNRFDAEGKPLNDNARFLPGQKVVATFDGDLKLEYRPSGESGAFHISGYKVDYMAPDEQMANNGLIEKVRGAYLIVQTAISADLPYVDVTHAKPLEKYALQMVCEKLKMDCSDPAINKDKIPVNPELVKKYPKDEPHEVMAQLINGIVNNMTDNIYLGDLKEVVKPVGADDISLDDLLAASGP